MSEEVAKRICEQMTYDIENLCDCCRKNEKDRTCIGCKELAIETMLKENKDLQQRINKTIDKIQLIIDLGFDYDGFNQVDSLKGLIDELVSLARESRNILKGEE